MTTYQASHPQWEALQIMLKSLCESMVILSLLFKGQMSSVLSGINSALLISTEDII